MEIDNFIKAISKEIKDDEHIILKKFHKKDFIDINIGFLENRNSYERFYSSMAQGFIRIN